MWSISMAEIIYTIEKHEALFIIIFTAVLAGATIFLWLATRKLWFQAERASQGAIILQANRDLFFHERMYKVRKAIGSEKPIFESNGGQCSYQDVEDYIGYFESLYDLMEAKILNVKMANGNFGYYGGNPVSGFNGQHPPRFVSNWDKIHFRVPNTYEQLNLKEPPKVTGGSFTYEHRE